MYGAPYTQIALLTTLLTLGPSTCVYAGEKIDACSLISAAQAGKVLGTKMNQKKIHTYNENEPGVGSLCNYSGGGIHGGFMLKAIEIKYTSAEKEITSEQNSAKEHEKKKSYRNMPKTRFESVSDLGDGAYIESMGKNFFELNVLFHGMGISIIRNVKMTAETKRQSMRLAKIALRHL